MKDKYAIVLPGLQAYDDYMGIDADLLNALTKCLQENDVQLKTVCIKDGEAAHEPRAHKGVLNKYIDKMDSKDCKLRCVIYMLQ